MFGKTNFNKENITKLLTVLIVAAIFFLSMSVLLDDNDSRRQISDNDGATETTLCSILSEIKGVGDVNVLVEYGEDDTVTGVIVTADGAGDPVVKSNIVKGVAALFDISNSNVMVFEKSQEEEK